MTKKNPIDRKLMLGVAVLIALTGCVGVVGDGYGDADVYVPGPDVVVFGGGFDHGHDVHRFSHRGFVSRGGGHHGGGGFHGHR